MDFMDNLDDPNSYKANKKVYKKALKIKDVELQRCREKIIEQKLQIDALTKIRDELGANLSEVLNSKGWRALDKLRKIIPKKKATNTNSHEDRAKDETEDVKGVTVKATYNSHYEDDFDFSKLNNAPKVKALAFYLPQFHTFPENDEWWGKGFTEWTNTKKSKPRFEGHYQPREPHDDIGYYALDNVETIKKQVALAKEHGIYGFCFYYYWFSGKRLMEKPLDLFLKDRSIDFHFCLCWANENWTRTWDGMDKNILIKQEFKKEDPKKFILDMKKYLVDPRYIKIDNKPLILIYNPDSIPDFENTMKEWRKTAKEIGIGEIFICSKNTMADRDLKNIDFVDAEFEFAPVGHGQYFIQNPIEVNDNHCYFNYGKTVTDFKKIYHDHISATPFYYSCTMGWDNSARKKKDYWVLGKYSPEKFYDWLNIIIEETERRFPEDNRFIFINAWNEWAEGTYLEPDKKYGYTNINTASKAIYGLPYDFKPPKKA